ncbi:fungal hydrophobin-domain-containing protein [Irpex lacteus]|nr:fungal hydrophobin-domain-containing protein [Irpex lacteus]
MLKRANHVAAFFGRMLNPSVEHLVQLQSLSETHIMKFTVATVLALPLLAVATPVALETRQSAGNCNTGPIQCCQQTISVSSSQANLLAGLLGIVLGTVEGLVGLGCSPISVIGVGSGSACNASPVCCENNDVVSVLTLLDCLITRWLTVLDSTGRSPLYWMSPHLPLNDGSIPRAPWMDIGSVLAGDHDHVAVRLECSTRVL